MAWCIGSIFPNPDLLIGTQFESRLRNGLDPPQHLLDTGCTYRYSSSPEAEAHHQARSFSKKHRDTFLPEDLLCQHSEEDAALYLENSHSYFNIGNRLEGIESEQGFLQLFFPAGRNIDRIDSCLLSYDSKSSGQICKKYASSDKLFSSSLSILKPILQVVANRVELPLSSKVACVPLAVRTPYQVYFLTSQFQDGDISLGVKRIENFKHSTSHVVWNPHVLEEAAVILGNGDLNIFDINSSESNAASCSCKLEVFEKSESFSISYQTVCNKRRKRSFRVPQLKVYSKNMWMCEYAWHPRNLLIGGGTHIDLIDLRQKTGSKQFRLTLANAPSSTRLFSNCNTAHKTEHFTALARGAPADMFQFAAGSTNHVMLYDIRQPKSSLLQWEHRMQFEPPRLLQMVYFSGAHSKLNSAFDRQLAGGRVILACAFRSGDLRAFSYGPIPQGYTQQTACHMGDVGVSDKVFSWGFPVKLFTPRFYGHKNIEQMFEVHGNNVQTLFPANCEVDQLAGFINSSIPSDPSIINFVQLMGSGSILSQSLHLMEAQQSTTIDHSISSCFKMPDMKTCSGKYRDYHYRVKYAPAFLKFMLDESVSPKAEPRDDHTATVSNVASPPSVNLKTEKDCSIGAFNDRS